jgi:hypothetical protein
VGFLVVIRFGWCLVFRVGPAGGAGVVEEGVELVLCCRGSHCVDMALGRVGVFRDVGKIGGNQVGTFNEDVHTERDQCGK